MEETHDNLVIPGWVWFMIVMFVVGVIVALVVQRDRRSSRGSRRSRSNRSSRRSRSGHRSRHESSAHHQRRRQDAPFDKI